MDVKRDFIALASVAIVLELSGVAKAQQPGPSGVSAGYEATRDRFHYRFENPSTFSTAELVPHEFTQTYWADNQWLVGRVWFHAGTHLLLSEFAATPARMARGDDYDTFFQPSADIVVAGTTGDVSIRSWRARQTIGLGHRAGFDWSWSYEYRRDRSIFGPGLKTVTHTAPRSVERSIITTRETTISHAYGMQIGITKRWSKGPWRATVGLEAEPLMAGRLTTLLPDKYPGQTIVFSALVAGVKPTFTMSYGRRWPVLVTAGYERTFSYKHSSQFVWNAVSVGIGLGWTHR